MRRFTLWIDLPLRPQGEIEIDGKYLSTISESGKVIETGIAVRVTGTRNGKITVREIHDVE